ncbi:MAG: ATP-binding cassette domain-containing protein [Methanomassiliicoccaceae archaeon]|nr:ATP-binding cassette domain-containing protein [Methanomassiliicoccaceae archaeon]
MTVNVIEFENVSLVRGGVRILDDISVKISKGESVAVIGPNGSGKSSMMKILKGDARPYSDENKRTVCRLFGKERWNIFDLRKMIGVVSTELQSRFDPAATVADVILSGFFRTADIYKYHDVTDDMVAAAEEAAARTGIADKLARESGKLSLGEMRRALIARALAPDPRMLLLDEPMTGLDIVAKDKLRVMLDALIKKGTAVVMITHDLSDIPNGVERIIMMKDGRIFGDGKKKDVLTSGTMSELYSSPLTVSENNGTYSVAQP